MPFNLTCSQHHRNNKLINNGTIIFEKSNSFTSKFPFNFNDDQSTWYAQSILGPYGWNI
eukprot:m.105798 g.105798  ORF g.105798 m.105798 type:complete len:59 (-) comp9139_c6_seq1:148-324(-)